MVQPGDPPYRLRVRTAVGCVISLGSSGVLTWQAIAGNGHPDWFDYAAVAALIAGLNLIGYDGEFKIPGRGKGTGT